MKNILFLETGTPSINGEAGGSLYSLLELIKGIRNQNYTIIVLFYHEFKIRDKFEQLGCKTIVKEEKKNNYTRGKGNNSKTETSQNKLVSWFKFQLNWIKLYSQVKYIRNILLKYQIDILHCNDRISTNFAGVIAAKLSGKKVIVHQRQYETKLPIIMKLFGKTVDKYYAISHSIAENLIDKLSIKENDVEVLFNWISEINEKNIVTGNNGNNILWIGRIVHWKGVHKLLEIVENLIMYKINFNKIVIYGEADPSEKEYFKFINNQITEKNLNNYFEFRGFKTFSKINHSEFKAFLHTSIKPEPFGRTIIESMSYGIPVFATNLGGARDIIQDRVNGFLYSMNNLPELCEKFSLLEKDIIKDSIINNALKSVVEKFSGYKQIDLLNNNYKILLNEKNLLKR